MNLLPQIPQFIVSVVCTLEGPVTEVFFSDFAGTRGLVLLQRKNSVPNGNQTRGLMHASHQML